MVVEQRVNVLATFRWAVPETQEHPDFVLRHVRERHRRMKARRSDAAS
jgi:hypothetical protein